MEEPLVKHPMAKVNAIQCDQYQVKAATYHLFLDIYTAKKPR